MLIVILNLVFTIVVDYNGKEIVDEHIKSKICIETGIKYAFKEFSGEGYVLGRDNLGCKPLDSDKIFNKIIILMRGNCTFTEKLKNVILINNCRQK